MMGLRRLVAAIGLTLALAGCSAPPHKAQVVLTYASPYSPNHPFSRADIAWIKHVEQASGGRIKIQPFWGGTVISSDQSVIEVKHGVVDIALVTPIYMRAGMKVMKTQAGFYGGVRTIQDQVMVYRCMESKFPIFAKEMEGVHVLAIQGGNLPNVLTRDRPIRRLEDLRGLRLRAPTELVPVLQKLGVDVVTMPMGEVYSAISKGVVDGVVAPADTIRSLHFNEVAKHFTLLQVPRGGYPARAISEKKFKSLPADLQVLLDQSTPFWEDAMAREIGKAEKQGTDFGKTHGMDFIAFPADEQARFDQIYNETAAEHAAQLGRYGIDGSTIYQEARSVLAKGSPVQACKSGA
jgi:TRAP-type C4-dicarboxylate transport system substrate-binding protein